MIEFDKFKRSLISIFDELFLPECLICKHERAISSESRICVTCKELLQSYKVNVSIKDCDDHEIGMGVLRHDGLARFLMHRLKFNKEREIAGIIAELIIKEAQEFCQRHHVNYIVPIPMHPKRRMERGFNQTELISKILARRLNLNYRDDLVIRSRFTKPQSTLATSEKMSNVKGSFEILKEFEAWGKDIILFDDIYTTGSTMKECSKVLLEHNTRKVYFFSANISNNKI